MDKRDHDALKKALRRHKRLIQALAESNKQVRQLWRNFWLHRRESPALIAESAAAIETLKGRIIN